MQTQSRVFAGVGLAAAPLVVFLVLALTGPTRRAPMPTAVALVAGLIAAAFLAVIDFTSTAPAIHSVGQQLMLGAVLPTSAALPLTVAAAVFHSTRHRAVGTRVSVAAAAWAITLPIGLFIAFFIGCAAGLVCF